MGDHLCTDKYSTSVVCGIAVSTDKGDGDESMPISATLQIVCGVTAYTNLSSVNEIAISRHGITPLIYPFVCLHHRRLCYSLRSSPASYPRVHGQMLPYHARRTVTLPSYICSVSPSGQVARRAGHSSMALAKPPLTASMPPKPYQFLPRLSRHIETFIPKHRMTTSVIHGKDPLSMGIFILPSSSRFKKVPVQPEQTTQQRTTRSLLPPRAARPTWRG
jgi:hypothetical protein